MDGVMSQEEINALLNGSEDSSEQPKEEVLTEKEKDKLVFNVVTMLLKHG